MASDSLAGRRKRGMMMKTGVTMTDAEMKRYMASMPSGSAKPGTSAFGQMAEGRREAIRQRATKGDLRIKTARKTVRGSTREKNKYLAGD